VQSEGESEIRLESGKSERRVRGRARSVREGRREGVGVARRGGPLRDRFAFRGGRKELKESEEGGGVAIKGVLQVYCGC